MGNMTGLTGMAGLSARLKWILVGILVVSLGLAAPLIKSRLDYERTVSSIDTAISYRQAQLLAAKEGKDVLDILTAFRDKGVITSVAVEEETLMDYIENGRVTLVKGSDVINQQRIGLINQTIIKDLYRRKDLNPYYYYLIVDRTSDFEFIEDGLVFELGREKVDQIGSRTILEIQYSDPDLMTIGLGFSKQLAESLNQLGVSVIPRVRNSFRVNKQMIANKFNGIELFKQVNTVLFEGDSVLGYPNLMDEVASRLEAKQLNVGLIEFSNQLGMKSLLSYGLDRVIRVHSIGSEEIGTLSMETAVRRYVRAVRERGVRVVYFNPYLLPVQNQSLLDENRVFFERVVHDIGQYGFELQPVKTSGIQSIQSAGAWTVFGIGLGCAAVLVLLLNLYIPMTLASCILIFGVYSVFVYLTTILGWMDGFSRYIGVMIAILFPTFAFIQFFPKSRLAKPSVTRFGQAALASVLMTGMVLLGAVLMVGLFSQKEFLLGVSQFYGVKLSFIIPLLLIGIYYFVRPNRMASIFFVFRRLFFAPVRTLFLVAFGFFAVFVVIYLLRSGNYVSFSGVLGDSGLRKWMEALFFIRPRTKEFLIGFPIIVMTLYYLDSVFSRNWLWFFNMLGAVALVSVMNSFCHFHTPLLVSGIRSLLGVGIGICVGLAYILAFRVFLFLMSYLHK